MNQLSVLKKVPSKGTEPPIYTSAMAYMDLVLSLHILSGAAKLNSFCPNVLLSAVKHEGVGEKGCETFAKMKRFPGTLCKLWTCGNNMSIKTSAKAAFL